MSSDILERIVAVKRDELSACKRERPFVAEGRRRHEDDPRLQSRSVA